MPYQIGFSIIPFFLTKTHVAVLNICYVVTAVVCEYGQMFCYIFHGCDIMKCFQIVYLNIRLM